jgi:hypothetical protein
MGQSAQEIIETVMNMLCGAAVHYTESTATHDVRNPHYEDAGTPGAAEHTRTSVLPRNEIRHEVGHVHPN